MRTDCAITKCMVSPDHKKNYIKKINGIFEHIIVNDKKHLP